MSFCVHFKPRAGAQLYSGHFDVVADDGRIVSVSSDPKNALYQAVAQATGSVTEDPKKEALILREKVKSEVSFTLFTAVIPLWDNISTSAQFTDVLKRHKSRIKKK